MALVFAAAVGAFDSPAQGEVPFVQSQGRDVVLVRYQSDGGLPSPGFDYSVDLTVRGSGRARLHRDGRTSSFRIGQKRVAALRLAIKRARFATLKATYTGITQDVPAITITHGARSVILLNGAYGPPRLRQLVSLLDRIAQR